MQTLTVGALDKWFRRIRGQNTLGLLCHDRLHSEKQKGKSDDIPSFIVHNLPFRVVQTIIERTYFSGKRCSQTDGKT